MDTAHAVKLVIFRSGPLTLVEYDDGRFAVHRDDAPLPLCRFDPDDLEQGVQAFRQFELGMIDRRNLRPVG
jgi:hypothetical protein